jgi:hypothetical protein
MFVVDIEKAAAVLDGMKSEGRLYSAVTGRFVLVALTRHERSRSQLARACSFLMQVLTSSLHWVH